MRCARLLLACGLGLIILASVAEARPRLTPGGILNVLTSPLRGTLRGFGGIARPRQYRTRQPVARRAAPPAEAKIPDNAPAAAAAATAAGAAAGAAVAAAPAVGSQEQQPATPDKAVIDVAKQFWPGAHEDLLGYIFWPGEYDDRLWSHGFVEIVNAIFAPTGRETLGARTANATTGSVSAPDPSSRICEPAAASATWPSDRIERMLVPDSDPANALTEAQNAALSELRVALNQAVKAVQAACSDTVAAAPAERIRTMTDRLWAIRLAGYLMREPLIKFYTSLTPAQKARLNAAPETDRRDAFDICKAASGARLPFPQIERTIRATADQRKALTRLEAMIEQTANSLRGSCPVIPPATPVARLDAALDRVDAITYAAGNLLPAFGEFYASLSEEQKVRLANFRR